jgi:8-oxo-dGTP diphosphatase
MSAAGRPTIVVLAAVVEREDGRLLVTRRPRGTHLAGLWEFPGGKCEDGESHVACLARELREELDVASDVGEELLVTDHEYDDRVVRLHFRLCRIAGEPRPMLGQEIRWVERGDLKDLEFPPADQALIELLSQSGDHASQR